MTDAESSQQSKHEDDSVAREVGIGLGAATGCIALSAWATWRGLPAIHAVALVSSYAAVMGLYMGWKS